MARRRIASCWAKREVLDDGDVANMEMVRVQLRRLGRGRRPGACTSAPANGAGREDAADLPIDEAAFRRSSQGA